MIGTFFLFGMIILIGFFGSLFYSKTKIPESLFLLIAGIIIGPLLGLIDPSSMLSISNIFTTIALIIVLMEGGINLDIFGIVKRINKSFVFTLISSILSIIFVFPIMVMLGFTTTESILFSISIAGTTSITVIHLMEKYKIPEYIKEILIMESVITDVLLITVIVIILQISKISSAAIRTVLSVIFSQISIAFLSGVLGSLLWAYFLAILKKKDLTYISTLGILFILYDFVEFVGGNGPIAVLTFSIFIGNITRLAGKLRVKTTLSEIKDSLIRSIKSVEREFSFFIKTFFFVYIGTLVNVSESLIFILPSMVIVLGILISRFISVRIFSNFDGGFKRLRNLITFTIPRGFSSILIVLMLINTGLMERAMVNMTVLIIFLTTFVSMFANIIQKK